MAQRPFTVRQLIEESGFELHLVAGSAGLDRECRGVSIGEHLDPTPWMARGSIHLTAGLALAACQDPAEGSRLLRRLEAAGMVALGLSIPHYLTEIPERMRAAADQLGLPLFAVTGATLFRDIERYVYDMLASEELHRLRRGLAAQQQLLEIVAGEAAPAGLTARLGALLGAGVLLLDAQGALLAAGGPGGGESAAGAAALAARAWTVFVGGARDVPSRAAFAVDGQAVLWREVVADGRARMVLLAFVEPARAQDEFAGATLDYAQRLLQVDLRRGPWSGAAGDAALMRELLTGAERGGCAARLALDGFGSDAPFRVVVVQPRPPAPRAPGAAAGDLGGHPAAAACAALLERRGLRYLLLPLADGGVVALLGRVAAVDGAPDACLAAELAAAAETKTGAYVAGLSGEWRDLAQVRRAYAQALQAAAAAGARAGGPDALVFADLGQRRRLLDALPDAELEALTASSLAPLRAAGTEAAARLMQSLACYLRRDCSLGDAADDLGVHRNTLGKRLARCERLLGINLGAVDDLVDVRLALDAADILWSRRAVEAL